MCVPRRALSHLDFGKGTHDNGRQDAARGVAELPRKHPRSCRHPEQSTDKAGA